MLNRKHFTWISTLAEIREQDTAIMAIRVVTNESHPIRSYFMNNKINDEYATKPRTIKPVFIRALDVRRIETTPYYLRPQWRKNRYEQIDQSLCAIAKGSRSIIIRAKTAKILEEKHNEQLKIYTDGSKKTKKLSAR
jgi:hypothetical protein